MIWRFFIERKSGRGSITGQLFRRTPHLHLLRWDFRLTPSPPPKERGNLLNGSATNLESGISGEFILTCSDTSSIICIVPSWFSAMGTCVIRCWLKTLRISSTMCKTWIGIANRAKDTPETLSPTWLCYRSGERSTEFIRLLFCTEKLVLNKNLSERNRVKTKMI